MLQISPSMWRRAVAALLARVAQPQPVVLVASITSGGNVFNLHSAEAVDLVQVGGTVTGPGLTGTNTVTSKVVTAPSTFQVQISGTSGSLETNQLYTFTPPTPSNMMCRLFQAPASPGAEPVLSDFTVATFNGYADETMIVDVPPYTNPSGIAEADDFNLEWQVSSSGGPSNTIYGYVIYYTDPVAGQVVYAWENLPTPKVMADTTDAVTFTVPFAVQKQLSATFAR